MTVIRVYDLAKELKQDSMRIITDLRREGVDISMPSQTVEQEFADRIRQKYLREKNIYEQNLKRTVKILKSDKTAILESPLKPQKINQAERPETQSNYFLNTASIIKEKRCKVCEKYLPMYSSDVCYACKDK